MFANAGAQNGKMFSGAGGSGSEKNFFVFAAMLMGFLTF